MKKKAFLISALLVFGSFYWTNTTILAITNMIPPQYSVDITDTIRRYDKKDTPIQLNKLANTSLGFGLLSPVVFIIFISLLISIGEATLIGLLISVALAILAILTGNRVLRNPSAMLNARKKARAGKGFGIFMLSILVILLALLAFA